MNPKQMRKIRNKAKLILLTWIKTVVKKEQHDTITPEKFSVLIKNPSYQWQGRTLVLHVLTLSLSLIMSYMPNIIFSSLKYFSC